MLCHRHSRDLTVNPPPPGHRRRIENAKLCKKSCQVGAQPSTPGDMSTSMRHELALRCGLRASVPPHHNCDEAPITLLTHTRCTMTATLNSGTRSIKDGGSKLPRCPATWSRTPSWLTSSTCDGTPSIVPGNAARACAGNAAWAALRQRQGDGEQQPCALDRPNKIAGAVPPDVDLRLRVRVADHDYGQRRRRVPRHVHQRTERHQGNIDNQHLELERLDLARGGADVRNANSLEAAGVQPLGEGGPLHRRTGGDGDSCPCARHGWIGNARQSPANFVEFPRRREQRRNNSVLRAPGPSSRGSRGRSDWRAFFPSNGPQSLAGKRSGGIPRACAISRRLR